ncbi:MAG TPA: GNVR domain-containing protein [Longimicrobiales bacterium]|nr:GNVR domain-containing protein [Longimicrobiales bacterium]
MTEERAVAWQPEEDEISLVAVGSTLLRHRAIIVYSVLVGSLLALVVALLTPKVFTASTSFVPQTASGGGSGLGGLAGLAGQFGVSIPTGAAAESPEFYVGLVTSREILGALALEEFSFEEMEAGGRQHSGTVADVLELEARHTDPAIRRDAAMRWLKDAIYVNAGRQTGMVSISVTTPWADLSEALARQVLELVNDFNLQTRQTQAAAERAFIETRLAEVQDSLRAAEDRLARFMENNRQWAGSPELTFQRDRLQRQVVMQQQVFTGLAEAHEQARIAEVRNTPVITVVERPERPVRPDPRGRVLKLALGVILGGMLGILLAFLKEYSERARREEGEEYREFAAEWAGLWKDVRMMGGWRRS